RYWQEPLVPPCHFGSDGVGGQHCNVESPAVDIGSMNHSLDPLLRPRSVAVVGASAREGSPGSWSLTNLKRGGFAGAIYAVNPRYDELQGIRCHASLAHLPEVPDLVIFAIADERIELAVDQAIELGVPAVLLMSALVIDNDTEPPLKTRV